MKNLKNKRVAILAVILLVLLVVTYKVVFTQSAPTEIIDTANTTTLDASPNDSWESVLKEIGNINFDTNVIQDQNFKSLKSIEIPLISLPVGRKNPFSNVLGLD